MVALEPIQIRTERLLLRRLARADASTLLEIHADAGVMRYSNSPPWQGIAEAHDLIDRSSRWLESGQHICLGITRVDTDGLIGTCTLFDIDRTNLCAEIGFVLGASAWRLGFMSEALGAVLAHAFDRLALNRIEADTDPQNVPAIRLLERLGFQREGVLRQRWITNGRKSDAALYGLLRDEWRLGVPDARTGSSRLPEPGPMTPPPLHMRPAVAADLPDIVRMLADDELGSQRERFTDPLPVSYGQAFDAIQQDRNNELVVAVGPDGATVAVLQLTFTPYLTHRGGWRATIEGVRVASSLRGTGLGRELIGWAVSRAQERGCHLVQLTTDKRRPQAQQFYQALGFVASHEGMKLQLPGKAPPAADLPDPHCR